MVYIRSTWLAGQWEPRQWSVFDRDVMTNNALEGWHHRLNNLMGHGHVSFYNLIHLLYTEARAVKGELCQLRHGQLAVRRRTRDVRIRRYFDSFNNGNIKYDTTRSGWG